jgi:hypothetical protein
MKWKAFIDRLRAEMPRHVSDVDADEIWSGIEPAVNRINAENQRRRRGGWLPLILLFGLGTVGGVYFILSGMDQGHSTQNLAGQAAYLWEGSFDELSHQPYRGDGQVIPAAETIGERVKSNGAGGNHAKAEEQSVIGNAVGQYASVSKQKASSADKEIARNSPRKNRSDARSGNETDRFGDTEASSARKQRNSESSGSVNQEAYDAFVARSPREKDLATYPPAHLADPYGGASDIAGRSQNIDEQMQIGTGNMLMASLQTQTSMMLKDYSLVSNTQFLNSKMYERKSPATDCPDFGSSSGLSFMIGVHGGASYPFRSMTSTETGNELMMLRDTTEQSLVSGNYGIDLMMRHKSGFEFRTGVQSMTMLEKLDLRRTVTDTRTETGIIAISINPMGDTVYISGDVPITTTTTERKRYYNKYRFVEIPVIIGYSAEIKNWRVGGEVGVIPGFLTKTEGKILDANAEFSDLDGSNPAVSGSNFSLGYYFGANVAHLYESGVELGFHPHVRFSPTDLSAADYPVRTRYLMVGMDISVRYRFGGKR